MLKKEDLQRHHDQQAAAVIPYQTLAQLPEPVQDQLANLPRDAHNILVLYTGGTIGMRQNDDGNLVATNDAGELLKPLTIKGLDREVNVVWFQVYPDAIDSTNARWVHWVTIGNAIRLLYDKFDGFVVIGGTDTMAHMMAAMNFMFPNTGKPIIGTGSQRPMFKLGDDATRNLYFALAAAASDISGAHLAFADKLLHGLHVFKVQDRKFDAFTCPARYIIGEFDGEVNLFDHTPRRNPLVNQNRLIFQPHFLEGVKVVEISPSTPSQSIYHDGRDPLTAVLLIITFGAGNVRDTPIYESEMTHLDAIARLRGEGVPVVLGSPMMDGRVDSPYETGAKAMKETVGAISGGDTTGATLHVKAMFCLALSWNVNDGLVDSVKFRELMMKNHVGELTMNFRQTKGGAWCFASL